MITQSELKEVLTYDPLTGMFVWAKQLARRGKIGSVAGSLCKVHGYITIRIRGTLYQAHRLAWLYVTGVDPKEVIDHINMDRSDNRFANLREATRGENLRNTGKRKHNTSGYKGVTLDKSRGLWIAQIAVGGHHYHLGRFGTPEEARDAYVKAAANLHGEFARAA